VTEFNRRTSISLGSATSTGKASPCVIPHSSASYEIHANGRSLRQYVDNSVRAQRYATILDRPDMVPAEAIDDVKVVGIDLRDDQEMPLSVRRVIEATMPAAGDPDFQGQGMSVLKSNVQEQVKHSYTQINAKRLFAEDDCAGGHTDGGALQAPAPFDAAGAETQGTQCARPDPSAPAGSGTRLADADLDVRRHPQSPREDYVESQEHPQHSDVKTRTLVLDICEDPPMFVHEDVSRVPLPGLTSPTMKSHKSDSLPTPKTPEPVVDGLPTLIRPRKSDK